MGYQDEMKVTFWCGTNREGFVATHQSTLYVGVSFPSDEYGLARIGIEHTREDICDPETGYGTDTAFAFADLDESELDCLIGMLETCKSKLRQE